MTQTLRVRHFALHVHFRMGDMMKLVLPLVAKRSCGGAGEPNTGNPHLITFEDIERYVLLMRRLRRDKHWKASVYLTPNTKFIDIFKAWNAGYITHVKWYPPEGTTGANASPSHLLLLDKNSNVGFVLQKCVEVGIPIKYHPEITEHNGVDVAPRKREALFYEEVAPRINDLYPGLRQIYAHLSTLEAASYAYDHRDNNDMLFELTCHHGMFSTLDVFKGGQFRPDLHCWPNIKDPEDLEALQSLLKQMLKNLSSADDQAGHVIEAKHSARVPGGVFTYHCSLELAVQMLDGLNLLDWADDFLWGNGKRFHKDQLPDDPEPIELKKESWTVDELISNDSVIVHPFGYDKGPDERFKFTWKLAA